MIYFWILLLLLTRITFMCLIKIVGACRSDLLQAASQGRQAIGITGHVQVSFSLCKETQTSFFRRENTTLSCNHSLFVICFVYISLCCSRSLPQKSIPWCCSWQQYDSTENKRLEGFDFCHIEDYHYLLENPVHRLLETGSRSCFFSPSADFKKMD